ncbi:MULTISPECIES: ABC transporter ATP-binding protein [Chryseobacterium]|uniref:Lipopolysaccharide transport system ATP-binding protein n=1 Tax=Chryseobacterium geocarposphaerae TaxID=1416776 RepID=A0A2M9C1K2_9FLAO|nr:MULTISPECIES: ABC transporter ATP-binding protein [Chryseobacterium]MPS64191.1 ABC transporter ATP-binding protein [Chryseobacterium sp.]PJJ64250.1 lipopolysaccharide transport system ATP-binding protein [Chryseobacterium geocarposphaerae]
MLALKAENISKQYRLGQVGTGTLSHDLNRFWHTIRGKEDPYLKIGETNDRSVKGSSDYVWSLRDINFEIEQGDAVGIIGRNGAGKSTLLKLLSKVTKPTTGKIYTNGRIASLLEVGTGFHPEMTGRENVFLNGAILGMTRKEITRKFDEIVDFSGVERYIDTPVKRYSSGMYVRLAFAVAAHLESEILIVDEVLAVGDAEFQKKCLGKMGDVSKGEGRTILFVSHNMLAIKKLCNKGILLEKGLLKHSAEINDVISIYTHNAESEEIIPNSNKEIYLKDFKSYAKNDRESNLQTTQNGILEFHIHSHKNIKNINIGIGFNDDLGNRLFTPFSAHFQKNFDLETGENIIYCEIENFPLKSGKYTCEIYIGDRSQVFDYYDKGLQVNVKDNYTIEKPDYSQGYFIVNQNWTNERK